MKIENSEILNLKVITPNTIHEDFRGKYTELYNKKIFEDNGVKLDFIQDDYSYSRKNILRGIHGDYKTWKLISCLYGAFYLVVVDNQPESKTYRKWEAFTLSEENRLQVLVPPGYGNGHLVLSDEGTIFHYKQTTLYERSSQYTILWNDPSINIFWPINSPILSVRDSYGD